MTLLLVLISTLFNFFRLFARSAAMALGRILRSELFLRLLFARPAAMALGRILRGELFRRLLLARSAGVALGRAFRGELFRRLLLSFLEQKTAYDV